ncbi:MAG: hypothetical protein KR126chlam3_00799 [Chlamydiae bacterium]|nr:hypothetical protein [Chlamydiota bacterium]
MPAVRGRFEERVGIVGGISLGFGGIFAGAKMGASLGSIGGVPCAIIGGIGGAGVGFFSGLLGGIIAGKAFDDGFQFIDTVNRTATEGKGTVSEGKKIVKHGAEFTNSGKEFAKKSFFIFIPCTAISLLGITGHYFTSSPDCKTISCQWENSDYVPAASGSMAIFGMVTIVVSFVYLGVRDIWFNK